ncbi:MAG: metallophosphoesterase family protein [Bacillota bacterium]
MTSIAHISDTHFGTEDAPVCEALRRALLHAAPDLVVLSGDITQRARRAQFRAARAFLDSLAPLPVLALPGNHDLPLFDLFTRFTGPYRRYLRHVCPTLAPLWQGQALAVVGVNSTRVLRHKHGALPAALVRQVAQQIAELPQAFKVVALHHPLAVIEAGDARNRARGADEALAEWTGAGADLILGGHIHLPYCILAGPASRQAVLLQAGTAVSTRRRGGQANSFNLVRFDAGGGRRMTIEQRDYNAHARAFACVSVRQAVFSAAGWALDPGPRP